MNKNGFALVAGHIEPRMDAERLSSILRSEGIASVVDGNDLYVGGASNLRIDFDKGINSLRSEGGKYHQVLAQVGQLAKALSNAGIHHSIDVCNDEWEEINKFDSPASDSSRA